jgi:hypothetical protein
MDQTFINQTIADTGFDESSSTNMYEPPKVAQNYMLFAMNRTCWETVSEQPANAGCPFDAPETDNGKIWMSSKQLLGRFMCFVLIEHVQFLLIYLISRSNSSKAGTSKKMWHLQRMSQVRAVILDSDCSDDPCRYVPVSCLALLCRARTNCSTTSLRTKYSLRRSKTSCTLIWQANG